MNVTEYTTNKFRQKLTQFAGAIVAGLAIVASANHVSAQDEGGKSETGDRPVVRPNESGRPRANGERPMQDRPGFLNRRGEGDRPGMREGMPGGPMMMPPVMVALDTDKDGTLSVAEIENASKALLSLDKDGDGMLSTEELRPKMPEGFQGGPRMAGGPGGGLAGGPGAAMMNEEMMKRMFEQRDANGDGKLEGEEIPPPMKERSSMIDTNGDGALDMDELKVAAQRMRERMGRGGEGGRLQQQNRRDGEAVRPKRPESEPSDDK